MPKRAASRRRAKTHQAHLRPSLAAAILAIAAVLVADAADRAAPLPAFQKGFTLGGWTRDDYQGPDVPRQLDALRAAGVEWVALTPRWWQAERDAVEIAPDPARSPSDESLRAVIRAAHARGLRVFLKPQLDLAGAGWRGEIAFASEARWSAWFASHADFLAHYARLAQAERVELFCVGVELDGTRHRERDWRAAIADVRRLYDGPLVYAANWNRERDVAWWDALDLAGVDAYFPLGESASAEDVAAAWQPHVRALRAWSERIGKPVVFTEIGYRSIEGAGAAPWEWQRDGRPSPAEQERLYRGTVAALRNERWLAGLYWWQWRTAPPRDPQTDTDFTPQGKPALRAIEDLYRSAR